MDDLLESVSYREHYLRTPTIYRTHIKFHGLNFVFLIGMKVRGVLIFMAMTAW